MSLRDGLRAFTDLGREAARMVLPSGCVVCRAELPWRARRASCCEACWSALPRLGPSRCAHCALPLPAAAGQEAFCIGCASVAPVLDWCGAWGLYEQGLERVLHAFKFERHDFLGSHLAALLVEEVGERRSSFDVITAVPMHPAKVRRRGFNQSALLATHLAAELGLPFDESLLRKTRDNLTQSSLPRDQRAENVRSVYEASADVARKAVLLIDDISTTGETLRASAKELKRRGASRVGATVVARVRDARP